MGRTIGRHAVVIGAGMAGLAAAGALASYFEQVTVLERDRLTSEVAPRLGAPQSRHLHTLLAGGHQALTDLLPHLERDLTNAGCLSLRVFRDVRMEIPGLGALPQRDFGWFVYCGSRPLIELITRQQIERLTNVTMRQGCRVIEITATSSDNTVTGLIYQNLHGRQESLPADLVIDASGRAAR